MTWLEHMRLIPVTRFGQFKCFGAIVTAKIVMVR